jgi:hypothetical protein
MTSGLKLPRMLSRVKFHKSQLHGVSLVEFNQYHPIYSSHQLATAQVVAASPWVPNGISVGLKLSRSHVILAINLVSELHRFLLIDFEYEVIPINNVLRCSLSLM